MAQVTTNSVDLQYRPRGYFWARDMGVELSSGIKGTLRKRLHQRGLVDGTSLPEQVAKPKLSEGERRLWGRLHPACMGGEYLPDRRGREVEIARIAIASTTGDVTSVYVRQRKHRFHYRVVDEYGGDTLSGKSTRTSVRPLTLVQLVEFFLGAWNLLEVLDANFSDDDDPRKRVQGFVTEVSSDFYAEFGALVGRRIDDWLDTVCEDGDAHAE